MADPDLKKPDDLVTVDTFKTVHEADTARLYLEQASIHVVISDFSFVSDDSLSTASGGDIKLQVPAGDAANAREILRINRPRFNIDYGYTPPNASDKTSQDKPTDETHEDSPEHE